jgi:hypothetical protein
MSFAKFILSVGLMILIGTTGKSEGYFSAMDTKSETVVEVYPNPTTSAQVTINAEKEINKIQLLNILGEEIRVEVVEPSTNIMFELGNLENGIYLVKITFTDNSSSTKRLWVK